LKKGDYRHAIHDYDQAIKLDPSYAEAFYNRGVAKLKIGEMRDGNADMAAARAINPRVPQ
jgi:tetratricopeptide (TPR) repeat protein